MKLRSTTLFVAALLGFGIFAVAQGGPPMRTDDPGTPGNHNWEINLAATTDRRAEERVFEAPLLDINYGTGEKVQLKFEIPFVVRGTDQGPTKSGLGNSLFGVKWRFYEDKKRELAVSVYPQLEFNNPTSSADRGVVDRGARMLLPVQVAKRIGPLSANAEVGYWITERGSDEWLTGLAVSKEVSPKLELVGELYGTGRTNGTEREGTFGGGARYKIRSHVVLLFMIGRSFRAVESGEAQLIGYLGVQFLLSSKKEPAPVRSGRN